jgi:hypothetical protein
MLAIGGSPGRCALSATALVAEDGYVQCSHGFAGWSPEWYQQ